MFVLLGTAHAAGPATAREPVARVVATVDGMDGGLPEWLGMTPNAGNFGDRMDFRLTVLGEADLTVELVRLIKTERAQP